ncbi:MAG: hypothetical protein V5B34_04625 [Accumulibacter sp.]
MLDLCRFLLRGLEGDIFIDGPQHEEATQHERDEESNRKLSAAGHYIVRFPKEQERWPAVFAAHAGLFGSGSRGT